MRRPLISEPKERMPFNEQTQPLVLQKLVHMYSFRLALRSLLGYLLGFNKDWFIIVGIIGGNIVPISLANLKVGRGGGS
jgi:hypothetical protein